MSSPSPLPPYGINWKFWLPTGFGALVVGSGVGAFLSSVQATTDIVPTVATGMMLSFVFGGVASWLDSKGQTASTLWVPLLALALGVWAGAANLAIVATLGSIVLGILVWPDPLSRWTVIVAIATVGGLLGGTITALVVTRDST
jgi:hypothetical protein